MKRDLLPTTIYIHGEPFDAAKSDKGFVSLRQTFGYGHRWFENENEFRAWAKLYLPRW